ncbi:5-oxoprolinase subunit B family protein [Singulisphaera acidiphila]|uniref:Allophanate hydrolase subunit 1 n=1 Tax=Singulisphaera acidiphila (strain ATCC BAA-1392 / DSM 18658 / VKM B-2454 / MOB10) TaxID=886293 RepID=L0DE17_SINAD|nr:allophanate hydrolase subunit 1 [Singulisphaera acidiphila]AGA26881.1 allophanate hydrolase subunit 1 [Singulisphaera acidiphila DSM 18658]
MISLGPLGDRAFLAHFATEDEASAWTTAVRGKAWSGVLDVVLAYRTAAVFADPDLVDLVQLETELRSVASLGGPAPEGRLIRLPVLYDGEDLPEVALQLGLTESDVVSLHSGIDYRVYAIGFLPGFPYAGYLPEALSGLPRRDEPRQKVPAGSVAIVGKQTAVYPHPSPGGWHLIGRTPLRIVDVDQAHFPIRAGDRIRFDPINSQGFEARRGELL